jgi:tRNA (adenine22-N1)-methyltransferase
MRLNKRLETIAKMIDGHNIRLADVGCDHGWLAIYLVKNKIASRAYACDVNKGPLDNARENIKKNNLEDKIDLVLSNGLDKLASDSFDSLVIAGMGGSLIVDIIRKDLKKLNNKTLYLQPNINSYGLRKYLLSHDFEILDEELVEENKIIYEIIKARKTNSKGHVTYNMLELMFGKINLSKKNHTLCELLLLNLDKINKIIELMPDDVEKKKEYIQQKKLIEEYLKENEKF